MTKPTPPLLMIAEGRKPRLRKAPVSRPKEIRLHMSVADLLRKHARADWVWTHIPAGEVRDLRTAAKLKHMGTKAGWPDFVLIPPRGQLHCLELKREGETLSEAQEEFRFWCIRNGVPYAVAYTMDEARIALDAWGCVPLKIGGDADA
jgi:hypothetical protein